MCPGSSPGSFLYIFTHLVWILFPVSPSPRGLPGTSRAAPPQPHHCCLSAAWGPEASSPLTPALFPS